MEQKNTKKGRRYSKGIVALIIVLNVIFTGVVLYSFNATGGSEPTTLIISWFAFTGTELIALAGIKCTEIKRSPNLQRGREQQGDYGDPPDEDI